MPMYKKIAKLILFILFTINIFNVSYADYPNTSIAVIDINLILAEAKSAKKAAKEIEEIAVNIENEIQKSDEEMLGEQNLLIESQAIMAPEAFENKRNDYEKKVQNYNIERQNKLLSIENLIANSRKQVLDALKPILEEISNEKGITIVLEKNTVLLNAEAMDITEEVLKKLDKALPKIELSQE